MTTRWIRASDSHASLIFALCIRVLAGVAALGLAAWLAPASARSGGMAGGFSGGHAFGFHAFAHSGFHRAVRRGFRRGHSRWFWPAYGGYYGYSDVPPDDNGAGEGAYPATGEGAVVMPAPAIAVYRRECTSQTTSVPSESGGTREITITRC
jgi:hypothetical protein